MSRREKENRWHLSPLAMYFKNVRRMKRSSIFLTLLLILTLGHLTPATSTFNEVVDCIAAVVNNRVITLADLKFMDSFGLYDDEISVLSGARLALILEKVIDQKVVIDLAREKTAVSNELLDQGLSGMIQKLGEEGFRKKLDQFGAGPDALRAYLEEKFLCQQVISQRFSQGTVVSLKEIEAYYQEKYVPERKKLGSEPEPMVQILDRIESQIKKEKTEQQIKTWIKNLRAQAEIQIKADCLGHN
jgi:hypothetical protein